MSVFAENIPNYSDLLQVQAQGYVENNSTYRLAFSQRNLPEASNKGIQFYYRYYYYTPDSPTELFTQLNGTAVGNDSDTSEWRTLYADITTSLPEGAEKIKLCILFTPCGSGSTNYAGYIDDLSLRLLPEENEMLTKVESIQSVDSNIVVHFADSFAGSAEITIDGTSYDVIPTWSQVAGKLTASFNVPIEEGEYTVTVKGKDLWQRDYEFSGRVQHYTNPIVNAESYSSENRRFSVVYTDIVTPVDILVNGTRSEAKYKISEKDGKTSVTYLGLPFVHGVNTVTVNALDAYGRTVELSAEIYYIDPELNLLGNVYECDSTSGFNASGAALSISTDEYVSGGSSLKSVVSNNITSINKVHVSSYRTGQTMRYSFWIKNTRPEVNRFYLVREYWKKSDGSFYGEKATYFELEKTDEWQFVTLEFTDDMPDDDFSFFGIYLRSIDTSQTTEFYIDCLKMTCVPESGALTVSDVVTSGAMQFKANIASEVKPSGKIVAAAYDVDGRLIQTKIFDADFSVDVSFEEPASKVKVMWIDSEENMSPLSPEVTVNA